MSPRRLLGCSATASASDSSVPQDRHFQMPFFEDVAESRLRCPHCAHVTIRAFICNNSNAYTEDPPRPTPDLELNRGNLKAESVWLTMHRCQNVTHHRRQAPRFQVRNTPRRTLARTSEPRGH